MRSLWHCQLWILWYTFNRSSYLLSLLWCLVFQLAWSTIRTANLVLNEYNTLLIKAVYWWWLLTMNYFSKTWFSKICSLNINLANWINIRRTSWYKVTKLLGLGLEFHYSLIDHFRVEILDTLHGCRLITLILNRWVQTW